MMNKYGYFKYSDFAVGAKNYLTYSTNATLQNGASLTDLVVGVAPYDFASIEQDRYITSEPKPLYDLSTSLAFLTEETSGESGEFDTPITLTANFSAYFSMTGITINSRNVIKDINITAYQDNDIVASGNFVATEKDFFCPLEIELANKIVFTISTIDKPYHFLGIFGIDFGKVRIFDDMQNVSAEIIQNFSVLGDTLEYDTLDFEIAEREQDDYLFQRKQPIDYIVGEDVQATFYIDNGTENDEHTIQVLAYDSIANLEDNFLGGIYNNYSLNSLIDDILANTNIEYEKIGTSGINVTGYLPISSRRKALQTVLQGTNIRCYKGAKLVFKALESTTMALELNESNIVDKPKKTKKQEIQSVTVNQRTYSRGTESAEAYHWYISTTNDVQINFSEPLHSLEAYEVIGVDQDNNDIVDENPSNNVTFVVRGDNYCVVRNSTANKVVIKGLKYVTSTVEYKKINPLTAINENYTNITLELTISSNPQSVCDLLYDLYSRKNSIEFITIEPVEIGKHYSILGENLNIKSIKNSLNGLYEVEAV